MNTFAIIFAIGLCFGIAIGIIYDYIRFRGAFEDFAEYCVAQLKKDGKRSDNKVKRLYAALAKKDTQIAELIKQNEELKKAVATFNTTDFLTVGDDFSQADIDFGEVQ